MKKLLIPLAIILMAAQCEHTQQGVVICDSTYVVTHVINLTDSTVVHYVDSVEHLTVTEYKDSVTHTAYVTHNEITTYKDSVIRITTYKDSIRVVTITPNGYFYVTAYMQQGQNFSNALQTAINNADAYSSIYGCGGTVIIPPGSYLITSQVKPKNFISIEFAKNAFVSVSSSYVGNVFFSDESVTECWISGGHFYLNYNTVFFKSSNSSTRWQFNHFQNIYIGHVGTVFVTEVANQGWFNGNHYSNIIADDFVYFWDQNISGSAWIEGNFMVNVTLQPTEITLGCFDMIGNWNIVTNCMIWDLHVTPASCYTVRIPSGTHDNIMIGNQLKGKNYSNLGSRNIVIGNGSITY